MGETTWCPSPSWEKRVNAFVLGTALMIKGIAVRRQSLVSSNAENFHWNNCWVAKGPEIRQSRHWFAGQIGQMFFRTSVWCPKYFFFIKFCKILSKNPFNSFFYFLNKITKMKIKNFECPKSIHMKKNINTCLTIHLSHQPIEPAYYILHWQISKLECPTLSMNPRHPKNLKFGEGSNSACEFFFNVLSIV